MRKFTQYMLAEDGERNILVEEETLRWLLRSAKAAWENDVRNAVVAIRDGTDPEAMRTHEAELRLFRAELFTVQGLEESLDNEDDEAPKLQLIGELDGLIADFVKP